MALITYTNKETLNEQPSIADKNKVKAEDMNEIKSVVNTNYGEVGDITTLTTTTKTSVVAAINELKSAINNSGTGYIKFDDGTMITYQEETNSIACNNAWGSWYYGVDNTTYYFPQEFISVPTVITSVKSTAQSGCLDASYNPLEVNSTTIKNFGIVRPTSSQSVAVKISILAIGKWK